MEAALPILLVALAVVLGLMTLLWLLSLRLRDASLVDPFWGTGFVVVAWIYHAAEGSGTPRSLVLPTLVTLWGLRLSIYLLWRRRGEGEDYRYAAMRARWGRRFPGVSLVTVFLFQGLLLWGLSLAFLPAVRSAEPPGWNALDFLGLVCFAAGLLFEAVGDLQLARFRSDPANRSRVLRRGLWRYTRHPNYFGDALVWWGYFCFSLATPAALWTIYSPLLMTLLLMRVSGVTLLEDRLREVKPAYRDYVESTSAFFPWRPRPGGRSPGARR
jgi:steroid 5-alpha reductase family enzyme